MNINQLYCTQPQHSMVRIIFLLLLMLPTMMALATEPTVSFERYTSDDGLSQNATYHVAQDRRGFMWFATRDGLNRFDGNDFRVFRFEPDDPHSISDNVIRVLHVDSEDVLWIGTSAGLNRFDPDTERFTRYLNQANNKTSLNHDNIRAIGEDSKGNLWVGTGAGLNKFNRNTDNFTRYGHQASEPGSLGKGTVRAIAFDGNDTLWVGTWGGGLSKMVNGHFEHFIHDGNNMVLSLTADLDGYIWVGTNKGLDRLNQKTGKFTRFVSNTNNPHSLNHNTILSLQTDSKGRVWVGSFDGVNQFDTESQGLIDLGVKPPPGKKAEPVWAIFEDRQHTLWLTTFNGVLRQLDGRGLFTHFNHKAKDPGSLSHNQVMSIVQTRKGQLWLGTAGGGVNRYDAKLKRFIHYSSKTNVPSSQPEDQVFALLEDHQNTLWAGTSAGLGRFDQSTQSFSYWSHDSSDPNSLSNNLVSTVFEDSKQQLWIGTFKGGLNRFDRTKKRFIHYKNRANDAASLSHNNVRAISEDAQGHLWVGTLGGGLNRLDPQSGGFIRFSHDPKDPTSLSSNSINSIYHDTSGRMWLGTRGGGLNLFDKASQSFIHLREKDGLSDDNVVGIVEDESGDLWISTYRGLSRLSTDTKTFVRYDVKDGLQNNRFDVGAYFAAPSTARREGELFFGGINGFNRFYPKQLQAEQTQADVLLTDLLVFNQSAPIKPEGDKKAFLLPKVINSLEQITLSHKENFFSIVFAALDFANPGKIEYGYQLQGWDNDWVYVDAKNRRATYTNLPPGEYNFKLKARLNHGQWHERSKSFKIVTLAPLWWTWWAKTLYALVVVALVGSFALVWIERRKRLMERNETLERASQEKSTFLATMSHEIRTPMNAVIGLSRLMLKTRLDDQQKDYAEKVVDAGGVLLGLINDILDFSKIEAGKLTIENTAFDLNKLVQRAITMSGMNARNKGLALITDIDENIPRILNGDPLRLQQIIVNLVNNAVKFTENGSVCIKMRMKETVPTKLLLHCVVIDTGIGMTEAQQSRMFQSFSQADDSISRKHGGTGLGLAISRQLCELMGGEIWLKSELDKGSEFHFTVLVDVNENPDQATDLAADEDAIEIPNLRGNHILLVDDNAINRQVALGFLADTGVKVDIAENGLIALARIQQQPYDMILMDIQMPQMDGMTATGEIRNTLGLTELPVIAMTAHAMAVDIQKTQDAGMNDHVTKPVEPALLYQCLTKYLETGDGQKIEETDQPAPANIEDEHAMQLALLAKLDGLDSQRALTKLNGRTELYLGLVKDFSRQQQNLQQQLMAMYQQQAWDELYRHVHSLKANAAYIGAFELSKLAGIVETALGQGERDRTQLQLLCDMLMPIMDELKTICQPKATDSDETEFSEQQLYDLLSQILPLLKASSFGAEELLPALTTLCQGTQYAESINELVTLVDDIEFEQAAVLVNQLLANNGASLPRFSQSD